jgi:hypothetical protein
MKINARGNVETVKDQNAEMQEMYAGYRTNKEVQYVVRNASQK